MIRICACVLLMTCAASAAPNHVLALKSDRPSSDSFALSRWDYDWYMTRLTRRDVLFAPAAFAAQAARKPNIVLVLLDDLGYGDFGCFGQQKIQTPNVDRIASQGLKFTDCYAGGTVCAPSRSTLMSGLHQGHAPIRANAGTVSIRKGDWTMAEVLKAAGYQTGGFGKWGLGDASEEGAPWKKGFDEFYGYLHQIHAHSYYPDFLWDTGKMQQLDGKQYTAGLIANRSFEFIRKNRTNPFFLYCCWTLPHARFEGPDVEPYSNMPWSQGQKMYASMVTRADRYIGTLMDTLREQGLDSNTLLLVTSDNGAHRGEEKGFDFFQSNGPLRGEKGQLYEGGIRVPLLARWPGRVTAGTTTSQTAAFYDFLPTFAEVAGARLPAPVDGSSILPTLSGGTQKAHEFLYWEASAYDRPSDALNAAALQQAVRVGRWKAVKPKAAAPVELYDLNSDIGESKDVAAANGGVVARMEAIMRSQHAEPRPHDNGKFDWVKPS